METGLAYSAPHLDGPQAHATGANDGGPEACAAALLALFVGMLLVVRLPMCRKHVQLRAQVWRSTALALRTLRGGSVVTLHGRPRSFMPAKRAQPNKAHMRQAGAAPLPRQRWAGPAQRRDAAAASKGVSQPGTPSSPAPGGLRARQSKPPQRAHPVSVSS